jgi:hypothetical protein
MRIFKLPAPVLAVILSIFVESFAFLVIILGVFDYLHFSALHDWYDQLLLWFHLPAAILSERLTDAHVISHGVGMGLMVFIAVFQWWLIFLAAICSIRHFRRKSA